MLNKILVLYDLIVLAVPRYNVVLRATALSLLQNLLNCLVVPRSAIFMS